MDTSSTIKDLSITKIEPEIESKTDTTQFTIPQSNLGNKNKPPIYVSLTSIFKNQERLLETLRHLLKQSKQPDKIFVYLSEESYILDEGFKERNITNLDLSELIANNDVIEVKWVENIGSFRKLIPLLKEQWRNNCFIITVDDDHIYDYHLIQNLVSDYHKHKCVISYRGFTPKLKHFKDFNYKKRDKRKIKKLTNFSTNGAGTLWKPSFFHKTKQLVFNKNIYCNFCSKQDDVWFYIIRYLNNINCLIGRKKWRIQDNSGDGLFINFNRKNNTNTRVFNRVIKVLKKRKRVIEKNNKIVYRR
jgi:hypothetical protein